MTIETLKKKLVKAFEPRPTEVSKKGNYITLKVKLTNNSDLVGFLDINADLDFESMVTQCNAAEMQNPVDGLFILDGSAIIPENAFEGYMMSELSIPGTVVEIKSNAFSHCENLKHLTICNGVKIIGPGAFKECEALESIALPDSIEEIRDHAFEQCYALKYIALPANLKVLGTQALNYCKSLTEADVPSSVTELGGGVFNGCYSLKRISIPETLIEIPEYLLDGCKSLCHVDLPKDITEIGMGAFSGCEALQDVNIPAGVSKIGASAFYKCTSLTGIQLPPSLTKLDSSLFEECRALTEMSIPDGVEEIGADAFKNCVALTSVQIPAGVKSIGERAFLNCPLITALNIPEDCEVGECAFLETAISTPIIRKDALIYVPASMTGKYVVPDGVTDIKAGAFYEGAISEVTIPSSVTKIGRSAFCGCKNLVSVEILGDVKFIPNDTFKGCTALHSISLPDSVRSIAPGAFAESGLRSITLPTSLLYLQNNAFKGCTQLQEVTLTNPDAPLAEFGNAFSGCTSITTVNLPKGMTWRKVKEKFPDSPWGKTEPAKPSKKSAEKAAPKGKVTYEMMIREALQPVDMIAIVEGDFINVKAKLPNDIVIMAKLSLKDVNGNKIAPTDFNCAEIKETLADSHPDTTFFILPRGTVLTQKLVNEIRDFASATPNVVVLPGITEIGELAFAKYPGLQSIILPEGLTAIENRAFLRAPLQHPVIFKGMLCAPPAGIIKGTYEVPDGVESIQEYAFTGCETLETLVIPASVNLVDECAFKNCPALSTLQFANPIKFKAITDVEEGYTVIHKTAFEGSECVKQLITPNSDTILGWLLAHMG